LSVLNKITGIFLFTLFAISSFSQGNIELINGSFEGKPRKGVLDFGYYTPLPSGWYDCGVINFPRETPPDIHPNNYWENTTKPYDGDTYLGMVVRNNETWESVSQRLDSILRKDICYDFTVNLTRSRNYWSSTREDPTKEYNYRTPAVLRIWGGTGYCDKTQLLGESAPVDHDTWKTYKFTVKPKTNYRYITLEAFYKTPTLEPYNGHILIDNFSTFIAYNCNEEAPILADVPNSRKKKPATKTKKPPHKSVKKKPEQNTGIASVPKQQSNEPKITKPVPEEKIIAELDRNTIKKGQTIKINNLYFAADSTVIKKNSYDVLNEVYRFLNSNKDIKIEIGGHTNIKPPHKFCDSLSDLRAKEVADYLIQKGIEPSRISHKGYGKRKPVINSKSDFASKKNQRVEIKILSMG